MRKQMQCIVWIVNVDKCCFCRFAIQETLGEGDVVEPLELHRGGSDVLEPASKIDPLLGQNLNVLFSQGFRRGNICKGFHLLFTFCNGCLLFGRVYSVIDWRIDTNCVIINIPYFQFLFKIHKI